MITQRSLKRLLVLSTIEDAGFLLLGLAAATTLGARAHWLQRSPMHSQRPCSSSASVDLKPPALSKTIAQV